MHTDARGYACIRPHLKDHISDHHQVVWNGKQNIQAKKGFSSCISQNPTIRKYSIYMYICTSSSSTALYVWTLNRQFLCVNLQCVAKHKMCHSPMILIQGGWRCIFLPLFLISKVLFNSWDELKAKPSVIKCYVGDQKTCELSNHHHHHSDHRMKNCSPHYETFHYSIYKQILRSLVQFWIHSFTVLTRSLEISRIMNLNYAWGAHQPRSIYLTAER